MYSTEDCTEDPLLFPLSFCGFSWSVTSVPLIAQPAAGQWCCGVGRNTSVRQSDLQFAQHLLSCHWDALH